jgi:predicted GNAT family N-acyltransferase
MNAFLNLNPNNEQANDMIEIRLIKVEETYSIRKEELRKNMDLSTQFEGDFDEETFHLGLFKGNELVSIASFTSSNYKEFEGKQFQLRGMATKEEYQGQGLGRKLVGRALKILIDKKSNLVWCHSRITAVDFYSKMDFKIIGEVFEIPIIGKHIVMYKDLPIK